MPRFEDLENIGTLTVGVFKMRPSGDRSDAFVLGHGQSVNPANLVQALCRKNQKRCTIFHPEYLQDMTCEVQGDKASGMITFEAPGQFRGKANYQASWNQGNWQIDALEIPHFFKSDRQKDGSWKFTMLPPPAPVGNPKLEAEVKDLESTWILDFDSRLEINGKKASPVLTIQGHRVQVRNAPNDRGAGFPTIDASFVLQQQEHKEIVLYRIKRNNTPEDEHEHQGYRIEGPFLTIEGRGGAPIPGGKWVRMKPKVPVSKRDPKGTAGEEEFPLEPAINVEHLKPEQIEIPSRLKSGKRP